MRRAARIAAWSAAAVLAVLALLSAALLVVGNTDAGGRQIEQLTARLTQGQVRLVGLGGRFPSHLTLHQLLLADDTGVWLTADDIRLDWQPLALLHRVIAIKSVHAQRLSVVRVPKSKTSSSSGSTSLPHIDVGELGVEHLLLGEALVGTPTELKVGGTGQLRSVDSLKLTLAAVRAGNEGTYALEFVFDKQRMDALVTLQEPAGGPLAHLAGLPGLGALTARLSLTGPRTAESVDLRADAGDLHLGAQGTLDLPHHSGDVAYAFTAPNMQPRSDLKWQSLQIAGRWLGPLERSQTTARVNASALLLPGGVQLDALSASIDARNGQLQINASSSGLQLPEPRQELLRQQPVNLQASLRLDEPGWPFTLTATHPLLLLQAKGRAQAAELLVDAGLELTDLGALAGTDLPGLRGAAGLTAHVEQHQGTLNLTAALKGRALAVPGMTGNLLGPTPQAQLAAQWTKGALTLEKLQVSAAGISAQLTGVLRTDAATKGLLPKPPLQASGQVALTNLALLSPQLTGRLAFNGKANGAFDDLAVNGNLSGLLGSHGVTPGPLSGSVLIKGLPRQLDAALTLKGTIDQSALQLALALQRDSAGSLHAAIQRGNWKSLQLHGEFWLPADLHQAHGNLALHAPHLQDLQHLLGTDLAGNLELAASVQAGEQIHLQLAARELSAMGYNGSGTLSANGPLSQLALNLTAQSPALLGGPANLQTTGVLDAVGGTLKLVGLSAVIYNLPVKQQGEALIDFKSGLKVTDLHLTAANAVLDFSGSIQPQLSLTAALSNVTPTLINAVRPGLMAAGTARVTASLSGNPAAPDGELQLAARGFRATGAIFNELPALDLDSSVHLTAGQAQLTGELRAGQNSKLTLQGPVPLKPAAQLNVKLAGSVDAGIANPLLEAHGRQVKGVLALNAALSGTLSAPTITGTASLSQGTLHDYGNGIELTQISGQLMAARQSIEITNLSAHAGPGTITITGTVGILQPSIPVSLHLVAKDAQLLNSNLVTSNVGADLALSGSLQQGMDLKGDLSVNRTLINIPNSFPPNVAVLDVRRPGQAPPAPAATGTTINLQVRVDAPHQVLVKGRGLDAELGGTLHISGTTDAPVVAGGFGLQRGLFTLGSSRLNFTEGQVRFVGSGPHGGIDPSLDFTAENQTIDATSRVHITGFADAPRFELTSVPQLPQDEIMARLLFGTSASQLTALQAAQIGVALASLTGIGGSGGLNPLAAIQKRLGLDRLSVGSNETTTASGATQSNGANIEAGRYVTDRVFADVKQNTDGTTQLKVSVDLTKRLKLNAQVGNGTAPVQGTTPDNDPGSSLGLSYRFEY